MKVKTHMWTDVQHLTPGGPGQTVIRYNIDVDPPEKAERLAQLLNSADPRQRKRGWRYLEGSARS